MRQILFGLVLMLASVAGATAHADTVVLDHYPSFDVDLSNWQFRFDPSAGTSWVQLTYTERFESPFCPRPGYPYPPYPGYPGYPYPGYPGYYPRPCVEYRDHVVSTQVQGLYYDAPAAQILFAGQVGKVVCATVTEKNGLFGRKWIITPTGACRVYSGRDDGSRAVFFEAK